MTEMDTPIQLACFLEGNKVLPVFDNLECGLTNSKYIKKYYKPSGAFYMSKWGHIVENRNFFRGNVKGVLMPKNRSVDINTVEDIKYAEAML
jgi:N-acylneuraminate cytidylyltransferase/CMP-N,N'-diacetyllegionaminic acid synthase